MASWSLSARQVQSKLRSKNITISDTEIVHIAALAIMIETCIHTTTHATTSFPTDHATIFQKTYQIQLRMLIYDQTKDHNLFDCAQKRQTDNETKDDAACVLCDRLDNHIQLLRYTRARFDVYCGCFQLMHPRTLLYEMTLLYVLLRNASKRQIDVYLFLQTTYALLQLHHRQTIFLTPNTKNRYFALWLMYFVRFYTDFNVVFEDWHANVPFGSVQQLGQLWISLCSLLFVRRYVVPSDEIFLSKSHEKWIAFVAQLNRNVEIVNLRKAFCHAPFLFNLDVTKFFDM